MCSTRPFFCFSTELNQALGLKAYFYTNTNHIMRFFLSVIIMLCAVESYSQDFDFQINESQLMDLKKELTDKRKQKELRIKNYLKSNPLLKRSTVLGSNEMSIVDVVNGKPVYYTTYNDGSVRSCGVYELRPGGQFGLDLAGENVTIAVWDRGLPLASHIEFGGRLLNSDAASEFSFHSTHVTGTIIAGGINPSVRGFCYRGEARAFDWFQDTEEMIDEVINNQLLVSNHSYGVPGGWNGANWLGDAGISMEEDYRFGYYDGEAAAFDNIAFNAPYYSIVTAAGNERGDSGDGTFPPDGPYDCITGFSTAKNVFTIGAVNKLNANYTSPNDIVMSNFSSWGPVDDGRIKPDLVAPGVNLLSASNGSDQAYGSSSGTSMASPSAAGVVALVNEAYHLYNNKYLTSASLKALLIHTAHEAGPAPGPDYSFGWGMISADKAVDFILNEDGRNRQIIEATLNDGETFEILLSPLQGKKITATIAWTDRAGTVPVRSLDPEDLMLVNDLDMLITDGSGTESLPWILNPSNPMEAATKGDNFRDNVEKIEFDSPDARPYTLRISHKGQLFGLSQNFSLVLEYESENEGIENLYWVNGSGDWSNGSNWANNSGGSSSGTTPAMNSKIIIDDNSLAGNGDVLMMDADYSVAGLVAFTENEFVLDLGGNTLTISGTTLLGSDRFTVRNGKILLEDSSPMNVNTLNLDMTSFEDVSIEVSSSNQASWEIIDNMIIASDFRVHGGRVDLRNSTIEADSILLDAELSINTVTFKPGEKFEFVPGLVLSDDGTSKLLINNGTRVAIDLLDVTHFLSLESNNSIVDFSADSRIPNLLLNNSSFNVYSDMEVSNLELNGMSSFVLSNDVYLRCDNLVINNDADNRTGLQCGVGKAQFDISVRGKYCYDNLDIVNVDLVGSSAVSLGENSNIMDSEGWFDGKCEELLFAEFSADYLCEGALSLFQDISDGNVINRVWTVDGVEVWGDAEMEYVFESAGSYMLGLSIEDASGNTNSWEDEIIIETSDIEENRVIQNPTQLASLKLAESYQWYNYGRRIDGETDRVYLYNGAPGIYWVLTFNGDCNRRSEILDLGTSVIDLDRSTNSIIRLNNPAKDVINLQWLEDLGRVKLSILSYSGSVIWSRRGVTAHGITKIPLGAMTSGPHIILIEKEEKTYVKSIIISH